MVHITSKLLTKTLKNLTEYNVLGYSKLKKWVLENIYFESRHERRDYFEPLLEINSYFHQKTENQLRTVYKNYSTIFLFMPNRQYDPLQLFGAQHFSQKCAVDIFYLKSRPTFYFKFTTNHLLAKFAQKELF